MKKRINNSRGGKHKAQINTASLPDIIFMLLFFFMVTTVLRKPELLKITLPKATELTKLEHRSLVNHIYIGSIQRSGARTTPKVQINDAFVRVDMLEAALRQQVATSGERLHPLLTNSLKIDRDMEMGIVNDVKTALRKTRLLKVSYAAVPENCVF